MSEGEDSTEVSVDAQENDKSEDPVEITIGDKVEEDDEEVFIPLDFLLTVPGLGKSQANRIIMMGYKDKTSIIELTQEELMRIPDMPQSMAKRIVTTIRNSQKKEKGEEEEDEEEEKKEEEKKEEGKEEEKTSAEPEAQPASESKDSEKEEVVFKIKGEEEEKKEEPEEEKEEEKKEEDKEEKKKEDEEDDGPGFFAKIKSGIGGIFKSDDEEEEDKKKEEEKEDETEKKKEDIEIEDAEVAFKIEGVDDNILDALKAAGYQDVNEVEEAIVEDLTMIDGIDEEAAKKIYSALHPDE